MANFFFGEGSRIALNVDQITYVKRDPTKDSIYVYFGKHDSFELKGETARHLIALLTRLDSEAVRAWKTAKPADPKTKKTGRVAAA
jgi:hypothetical protein